MMTHLAATSPITDALQHIVGFAAVVLILSVLWAITAIIGRIFLRAEKPMPAPVDHHEHTKPMPVQASPAPAADEDDEEEMAAVCATVALVMGAPHRIVSIKTGNQDWSREGRREHFASHRLR